VNRLTENQMTRAQSLHYRIPSVDFAQECWRRSCALIPRRARKHEVMPLGRSAGALSLAMVDPTNLSAVDDLAFRTGTRVSAGHLPAVAAARGH